MSSILFHGPNARQEALSAAHQRGRLVAPPLGDAGLKIDEVRAITELMLSTPVGMNTGVVLIGPMDRATPKASDGLLLTIEENPGVIEAILWAYDLGEVSPTLRSRCLDRWCPKTEDLEDDELEGDGRRLVDAALNNRAWEIPALVRKYDAKGNKRLTELLAVVSEALSANWSEQTMGLWERVRSVALHRNPTSIEIIAALLPETSA